MLGIPWIGNVVWGIGGIAVASLLFVTVIIPFEKHEARKGYVLEAKAIAAEAKAQEMERQVKAGEIVIASYREVAQNAKAAEEEAQVELELRIKEMGSKGVSKCPLNQSDILFLEK